MPAAFVDAVVDRPGEAPLDAARAGLQHASYVTALGAGGYDIVQIPMAEEHPDSPFIEDTAVLIGDRVLLTRPGHPSRRGEVAGVARVLGERYPTHEVRDPATLDGGDVLIAGRRILVGLSGRTNVAGLRAVAAVAEPQGYRVRGVRVRDVLHLKSGLSAIDDRTVLWHRSACDRAALDGLDLIEIEGDDPEAANAVRLADGSILVGGGHDATAERLEKSGRTVRRVDVSEFGRADGGLTCLSIRVR